GRRHIRQRWERQAIADGGVTWNEKELFGTRRPDVRRPPAACARRLPTLHRQYERRRRADPALEDTGESFAHHRIVDLGVDWIDILRKPTLESREVPRILERRHARVRR